MSRPGSRSMPSVATRTSGALTSYSLAFPLWLLAVWWLGRQQPLSAPCAARCAEPDQQPDEVRLAGRDPRDADAGDRRAHGRVIDVNRSACEFIGRSERSILGIALSECLFADPPAALEPVRHRSESCAAVACGRPIGHSTARCGPGVSVHGAGTRVIDHGDRTHQGSAGAVGPGRLLDDARRFADWIGGLQGTAVVSRRARRLFLPPRVSACRAGARRPITRVSAAHLLASADRARFNASFAPRCAPARCSTSR